MPIDVSLHHLRFHDDPGRIILLVSNSVTTVRHLRCRLVPAASDDVTAPQVADRSGFVILAVRMRLCLQLGTRCKPAALYGAEVKTQGIHLVCIHT